MQEEEEEKESLILYLKKELEEALERNDFLEKENRDLKQEMIRLKAQIVSLKLHESERKSMLWKKFQSSGETIKNGESRQKVVVQELQVRQEKMQVPNAPPKVSPSAVITKLTSLSSAPPPPPLPSKMFVGSKSVRRVPEVVELYRLLSRKNANMEKKSNSGAILANAFTLNMIGEIENRSTHLTAIKSDVEKRKEFINVLIKEVESAAFKNISDVENFVEWLDQELSSLVDERAVLKHFSKWPEHKADALREAAFNYRDLRNLDLQVSSFQDDPKESLSKAVGKMQALQDRLETSLNGMERTRESMMKKYKDFQIPWEWLLDSGLIGQMKLSSLKLGREYMRRIVKEVQQNGEEDYLLQGARFAHRIHQFAGGFDNETIEAFHEMKKVGMSIST
ncbi:INCREASED PETAL GROWTH ANISOTROPY 1-like protein 1 [Euphorbia lathyris]|uniref:INCREASED PETAL GROWTH ANISOTROPY 1-like protein 1 n=1 Tax=Euphorbia lathyris TaxID=212925 RepID=UPI0033142ADB